MREDGAVLLRRRPETGLLGGMLEVPSTDWAETLPPVEEAMQAAPVRGDWQAVPGIVTHTFTHFRLDTVVYRASVPLPAELTASADPPAASGSPAAISAPPRSPASCARLSGMLWGMRRLGYARRAVTRHGAGTS